jgi:serine kinase of HPr protein (carbohydrate metabolism regulator)
MLVATLQTLFARDLNRLRWEIEEYKNEDNLWKVEGEIANAAGNLCLHLIGNLCTYIGKGIGNIEYVRNRELEFSLRNVSRNELLKKIDHTITVVDRSLQTLDEISLAREYPVLVFEQKTSTEYLLVHLTTHLTYHLGQINYHRRLLDR